METQNLDRVLELKGKERETSVPIKILSYILLSLGSILMLAPFLWMVSTSLKEPGKVLIFPPQWIPDPFRWRNFYEAWTVLPFHRFFINSVLVSTTVTLGQVMTSALAGYAFARLRFPGRDRLFIGYMSTMMIPFPVLIVPIFIMMRWFHLYDSLPGLILPIIFSAYGTFLLRQFFITIPKELEEAAVIDGCGKLTIFWRIILPLSKPALATLTTFCFMFVWNDFMWPYILIDTPSKMTLPVGLVAFQGRYQTDWHLLMAASVIALIPVIIVYCFSQRFFIKGIVLSGLKG